MMTDLPLPSLQASKHYLAVARSMKQYEQELYGEWLESVDATLPGLLKRTVLTKPPSIPFSLSVQHTPMPGDSRSASRADYSHLLPPGGEQVVRSRSRGKERRGKGREEGREGGGEGWRREGREEGREGGE